MRRGLVIFLCALGFSSVAMGIHLPSHSAMIYYEAGQKLRQVLRHTSPFDHIGVHEIAPGKYQAVVIGRLWSSSRPRSTFPSARK